MSEGWTTVLGIFAVFVTIFVVGVTGGELLWASIKGEKRLKWGLILAAEILIIMTIVATAIDAGTPK
jgi:drug/metabolite transporter superfamily protein YnfA